MNTHCIRAMVSIILLSGVNGNPRCEYDDRHRQRVICTHEDYDEANGNYILPKGVVSGKVRVYSFWLNSCKISDIDKEAFDNSPSLQRLTLSENKLQTLKSGVFDPIENLKSLNLSYNLITDLPSDLFKQNNELLVLDLNSNRLKTLHFGLFQSLTKLAHLYLAQNYIKGRDLHPDLFQENKQIKELDVSGNILFDAPKTLFTSLEICDTLILDDNYIIEIPLFVMTDNFKNLQQLSLNKNRISRIDDVNTFNNLYELRILELNDNQIVYMNEVAFKPLIYLYDLQLSENRLEKITDTQFQYMPSLRAVDLSKNHLTKVSANAFDGTSLLYLNVAYNKITYLEENFCMKLNSSGDFETLKFDNNPWQCACMKELLREVKTIDINYEEEYFNGNNPVCVTTSEFVCKRQEEVNSIYIELYNNLQQ